MTYPVYKIETLTGAVLDHTIEKEAIALFCKEIITDGVGHFWFIVPTKKNGGYYYDDIANHDKVKIYLGYNNVGATPDFIGRVTNISAPLSMASGYVRRIVGLSQGEILLRRFKKNKYYDATGASTIVTELATDLSLGTGKIIADATAETIEVKTKRYFDLLREVSDYWASAETQVKKDFYLDVDGDLVWKARPLRTSGVETLTVGDNIVSYNVTPSIKSVKNDITVYGAAETFNPADKDAWTEPDADPPSEWTATIGTMARESVSKKVGSYSVECQTSGDKTQFHRSIPLINLRDITTLKFWRTYSGINASTYEVRLWAPDNSNYFKSTKIGGGGNWEFKSIPLGPLQEYHVDENPDGAWTKTGSPNWYNIQGIEFYTEHGTVAHVDIDALYFEPVRYSGSASDATSKSDYGQRDAEFTDDKLHSDSECEKRAETLLYQLKDELTQIDVTTVLNSNIKIGDRLSMTIPAENISAANYDVIAVEHMLTMDTGFLTKAIMVNSANTRQPVEADATNILMNLTRKLYDLAQDIKRMG